MRFLNQLKTKGFPNDNKSLNGNCFKNIQMKILENSDNFEFIFILKNPLSKYCVETITVSNYLRNVTRVIFYEK